MLPHSLLDSAAGCLLSGNGLAVLVHAWRQRQIVTRNGKHAGETFLLSWTSYPRVISREAFYSARNELVEKGFIRIVHFQSACFAESDGWKSYRPTPNEAAKLSKHDATRKERVKVIKEYRAGSMAGNTSHTQDNAGVGKADNQHGRKNRHPLWPEKPADPIHQDENKHHHHHHDCGQGRSEEP